MYRKILTNNLLILKKFYYNGKIFGYKVKPKNNYVITPDMLEARNKYSNFYRLVESYRIHSHKFAQVNPLNNQNTKNLIPQVLDEKTYNLSLNDIINFNELINIQNNTDRCTIKEALNFLNNVYVKYIGVEFMHLENEEEILWFSREFESSIYEDLINKDRKIELAKKLICSQTFDYFLATKYPGLKRYGGEGSECTLVVFDELLKLSIEDNLQCLVIGMCHRGRLNLLTGLLKFPPVEIFAKINGHSTIPEKYSINEDVLSHFKSSIDLQISDKNIHISLLHNPSHLEAVNPVSMGKTRAKQLYYKDGDYGSGQWSDKILNIQVHGDAAIIGQGINQECLVLSQVPNFNIGGSIHLVINNQIGFTTPPEQGRSSRYCTDISKIISCPVIHVNGDHPEEVLKATRLAFKYQRQFRKDIFIDMNCYRKWGHNELDDPTITNPLLYKIIHSKKTVPDSYGKKLINEQILDEPKIKQITEEHYQYLNDQLKLLTNYKPKDDYFKNFWKGYSIAEHRITKWNTGVPMEVLIKIGQASVTLPENFTIHPNILKTHIKNRLNKINDGKIDWATAEALAFGSLLFEGYNVRISGEDVGRGTFSQRHVTLTEQNTNEIYTPLNYIHPEQTAFLEVANSILSEEAVLGFEYGMSIENPQNLIIWEAQFGDFFNVAQSIFDTFVCSGEDKWLWSCGLVILLPHGYDGAGPEHSSCRIERFLQLTNSQEIKIDGDDVNIQVCHISTPAQYFHLLRRQMIRNFRKPLIVVAPKTLLRLLEAVSDISEMTDGNFFRTIIGDITVTDKINVKKILLTSGKHYYLLKEKRDSMNIKNVPIIRLESYCPFPAMELQEELKQYPNAKLFIWCQEEPRNMGAWNFIKIRFENLLKIKIQFCGRSTQAVPAVGIGYKHKEETQKILTTPFMTKLY